MDEQIAPELQRAVEEGAIRFQNGIYETESAGHPWGATAYRLFSRNESPSRAEPPLARVQVLHQ